MSTQPRSYRISETARTLIKALSQHLGINATAVIELAVREKAKREEVKIESTEK